MCTFSSIIRNGAQVIEKSSGNLGVITTSYIDDIGISYIVVMWEHWFSDPGEDISIRLMENFEYVRKI